MTYRSLENKWKRLQQRPCLFRVSPNRFCYLCSSEYYRERLAQHRCLNQACSEDFWCVPFSRSCRGGSCAAAVPTSGIAKQPLSHPGSYFHFPPPPPPKLFWCKVGRLILAGLIADWLMGEREANDCFMSDRHFKVLKMLLADEINLGA